VRVAAASELVAVHPTAAVSAQHLDHRIVERQPDSNLHRPQFLLVGEAAGRFPGGQRPALLPSRGRGFRPVGKPGPLAPPGSHSRRLGGINNTCSRSHSMKFCDMPESSRTTRTAGTLCSKPHAKGEAGVCPAKLQVARSLAWGLPATAQETSTSTLGRCAMTLIGCSWVRCPCSSTDRAWLRPTCPVRAPCARERAAGFVAARRDNRSR
jgi:hypothetical protein